MKYIRADLFMNKIAGSAFFSAAEKGKIRAAIEKEPGEDVTPVVHAHWIVDDKEMSRIWNCHCSYCGKDPQYFIGGSELWWIEILPKYCPHCGAKMDEEESNC